MKIKLDNGIKMPFKKHENDAGWDIYSPINGVIPSKETGGRINLGVGIEIPKGYVGMVEARSSQGMLGISSLGKVVDCGYTGNIHLTLQNAGTEDYHFNEGDRICQLVVHKIYEGTLVQVNNFEATERGSGAHGSTGK